MRLVELEDMPWFPSILRDQQLGYIGWLVQFLSLYDPIVQILKQRIEFQNPKQIIDLCSGSGEPMNSIAAEIQTDIPIILSDLYPPSHTNSKTSLQYDPAPLNVLSMDFQQNTFYTMFNAFHHFEKSDQKKMVQSLKASSSAFLFVEVLEPRFVVFLKTILANTLGQFLLAPFVRPFSWWRILFTYIFPVNLLTTTYDGAISVLKSKNKKQYQTLLSPYDDSSYGIQISKCKAPFLNSLVIIQGHPKLP